MFEIIINLFSLKYILFISLGTIIGLFAGMMPGLSSGSGIILVLPITFYMDVKLAMVFLVSIYLSAMCGGGLTSTYFNIPGTPMSVMTALDGYPMAKKGKYGEATGLIIGASFLGGLISFIVLSLSVGYLSDLATKFGPIELFFAAFLGMICAVGIKGKHPYKSLASGLLGFLLGTIGYSPTGAVLSTFEILELIEGIPYVPLLIGMLCMSEVLRLADRKTVLPEAKNIKNVKEKGLFKKIFSGIFYTFKTPLISLYSALIGIIVGIIPGEGATLASFLSYSRAKATSKNKAEFGSGIPEGVIAAEAANNASVGGGLLTSLLLGIPGTATCAILLGALMMHGIPIGPMLILSHNDLIYTIIFSLFIANIIMLTFAIIASYYLKLLVFLSTKYLVPLIVTFCCLGAYMVRNSIIDVWIMFFLSILAFVMEIKEYPVLPLIVAIIVSPIANSELIRAYQIYQNRIIGAIFSSPISLVLIFLNILLLVNMFRSKYKIEKRV